jgi:hypothetical protein
MNGTADDGVRNNHPAVLGLDPRTIQGVRRAALGPRIKSGGSMVMAGAIALQARD